MLTGRAARTSTWRVLDEWVDEWSAATPAPRKRTARKAPAKKAPATEPAAETIGTNPERRYGSAGSRSLSR